MEDQAKAKIVGAFVVGFAIVAGSYTISNFGRSNFKAPTTPSAAVAVSASAVREPITVTDSNNDGIEDWQESFFRNKPAIVLDGTTVGEGSYTAPATLTAKTGISVFQDLVNMKGLEGFGPSEEDIILNATDQIREYASDEIIDLTQVKLGVSSEAEAVRAYANAASQIIIDHGLNDTISEVDSLRALVMSGDESAIEDLAEVAAVYKTLFDKTLALEVPPVLAKEHLDIVNVYQALEQDIKAMGESSTDPLAALARLKRYQDDAKGLVYSIQNMYEAIEPYAVAFERTDPAILLVTLDASLRN